MANTKTSTGASETDVASTEAKESVLTPDQIRDKYRKENTKLIRCKIIPLDPADSGKTGELVSVGNTVLGDISKIVMFNSITHIPNIMYKVMKESTFYKRVPSTNPKLPPKMIEVPKYSIEVLPTLTQQELDDLREQQRKNGSFEGED